MMVNKRVWIGVIACGFFAWAPVIQAESGFLGIGLAEVDATSVKELSLPKEAGARVLTVLEDSAAARGGIKVDDVIVQYNGQHVESAMALQRLVSETPANRTVRLSLVRGGHVEEVRVTLGERPMASMYGGIPEPFLNPNPHPWRGRLGPSGSSPQIPPLLPPDSPGEMDGPRLGVLVQPLSPQLAHYLKLEKDGGLWVQSVVPDSAADKAGVKTGDVLTLFDGTELTSPQQLVAAVHSAAGREVTLTFLRKGKLHECELTIPPATDKAQKASSPMADGEAEL